jgi:hypothetical protein
MTIRQTFSEANPNSDPNVATEPLPKQTPRESQRKTTFVWPPDCFWPFADGDGGMLPEDDVKL